MSACSHGIFAIAMQLHKKGAATSAVVTFRMASPWANLLSNIGKRSALWLPVITVPQILVLAWAMNLLLTPVATP